MECRYVKPMENEEAVELFQRRSGAVLDSAYAVFIKANNGGRPERNIVTLKNGSEKVVNTFLSFNEADKENVYKAKRRTEEDDAKLIPFAADPSGNYFCFKDSAVYFYDHEDGGLQMAADSFTAFLDMLKE